MIPGKLQPKEKRPQNSTSGLIACNYDLLHGHTQHRGTHGHAQIRKLYIDSIHIHKHHILSFLGNYVYDFDALLCQQIYAFQSTCNYVIIRPHNFNHRLLHIKRALSDNREGFLRKVN